MLGELPAGSRIGTGSPRRAVQLHALGLGLEVVPIRGNVDTRIGRVIYGELDGVVVREDEGGGGRALARGPVVARSRQVWWGKVADGSRCRRARGRASWG